MISKRRLVYLLMLVYLVSYITRINFSAVVSEMCDSTGISKVLLSLSLTGRFITYGAGQVVSGILGDRFNPKKLVLYGLVVTTVMNFLIPLCPNPYFMIAVWCVNGFAQAFMWPPIVRIMTTYYDNEEYGRAAVIVSYGSSIGTIIIYLVAPLLIQISGWKAVFAFSVLCGAAFVTIWNKYAPDVEIRTEKNQESGEKGSLLGILLSPVMIFAIAAIILQGMLKDGVATWMPSYIAETFKLGNAISILTGVILPFFGMFSYSISLSIYNKKIKNPVKCAGVIFATGMLSAVMLYMLPNFNPLFSVFCSALLTGCMHGVNLMLISILPAYFKETGKVSTVSGILNACVYVGSAIFTYGVALLAESFGWRTTIFSWVLITALGTASCIISSYFWKKNV